MKKFVGILIGFALLLALGCQHAVNPPPVYLPDKNVKPVGFARASEPTGFDGVRWRMELLTLQDMHYVRTDPSHGGITFYVKKGDGFRLKDGKVLPVQYGFWEGKFYVGMVTTRGPSDWDALKTTVFDKYGRGAKPFTNKDEYLWYGEEATMALRYDDITKAGIYYIRSGAMEKQMTAY